MIKTGDLQTLRYAIASHHHVDERKRYARILEDLIQEAKPGSKRVKDYEHEFRYELSW